MSPSLKSSELKLPLTILFFLVSLTIPEPTSGQEVTAAIIGKVTDPSGFPILGAKVKPKDIERRTFGKPSPILRDFTACHAFL